MQSWRLAKLSGTNYNAFKIMAALAKSDEPIDLRTISKLTRIPRGEAADYVARARARARIVDPNREKRDGPKGYPPSSIFRAILLMYLLSMDSVIDLVRFLREHQDWLVILELRRRIKGRMLYRAPDRTTFYKFADRLGPEKIIEVFSITVVQLIKMGIITGEKVSLDCSIIERARWRA